MSKGWIAVDLDGTIAHHTGWKGEDHIGEPIPKMVERVKRWLADGKEVGIFTARVGMCDRQSENGVIDNFKFAERQQALIKAWCKQHIGQELRVTASKDFEMLELWDDRAIQVIVNEGEPVASKEDRKRKQHS